MKTWPRPERFAGRGRSSRGHGTRGAIKGDGVQSKGTGIFFHMWLLRAVAKSHGELRSVVPHVINHQAAVLDEIEAGLAGEVFGFFADDAGLEPDGFGAGGDG